MLIYNSLLKKLILPEYGRNVQQMVNHCMTIEDREERNKCAHTIIAIMDNMLPEQREEANHIQKLWDHLAIMSEFKLDVDYPVEIVEPSHLATKPERIKYQLEPIKYRHYGKIIERMIERAAQYPEGEERNALVMLLANHMKKSIYQINNEVVEDSKIFNDLAHYSHGVIRLNPETDALHEFQVAQASSNGKKKKKK